MLSTLSKLYVQKGMFQLRMQNRFLIFNLCCSCNYYYSGRYFSLEDDLLACKPSAKMQNKNKIKHEHRTNK